MNKFRWIQREWQRFRSTHLLIIITLVLGLGGVFLIERLKVSFLTSIGEQERELLSSDLALTARRPLKETELKAFEEKVKELKVSSYRVLDMSSMLFAPKQNLSRLVEVRVVEPGFPFYGELIGPEGKILLSSEHPLFTRDCLLVHEEARRLMGLERGDRLKVGEAYFEFCQEVSKDSTQGFRGFALAPRVYLGRNQLEKTQLFGLGSIASHGYHVKLSTMVEPEVSSQWQDDLKRAFNDPAVKVQRPTDTSEQVARSGKLFGDYLQLTSLVALILAVVGLFYLFRTLVQRRLKDTAILRSLGVSSREARTLMLAPVVLDYLLAIPLAALFSALLFPLLSTLLFKLFGLSLTPVGFPWSIWPALPLILGMTLCTLMPTVYSASEAKIMALLQETESSTEKRTVHSYLWPVLSLIFFSALSVWASHSFKIGALFVAGITLSALMLFGITWSLSRLGEILLLRSPKLSQPFGLMFGLIIRRLLRRPFTTMLTMISLGLGSVLISLLGHMELILSKEFSVDRMDRPALFMFDIQDEQTEKLTTFIKNEKAHLLALSPMVRAKLVAINDAPLDEKKQSETFQTREEENEARFRQRMMNLSWASELNSSETLVAGVSFKEAKVPEGEAAVSIEKRFADRLDIELGDQLSFEVLGVPVLGRVVNVRTVKWTSFRPNFFIVFAPGFLEEAPKSWLAAIGPLPAADKAQLQNRLSKDFPNVSSIDVAQLVERIMQLFTRLKSALELMALFSFLVGIVVVAAMAQDQVMRRQKEVMLEKTLGLSPLRVSLMILSEFLILALIAFLFGALAGAGVANVISVMVFEGELMLNIQIILSLVILGMTLVTIPLFWMIKNIFTWRPAGLLQGA